MCKDHKCFTWFCIYIRERQKLTAAVDVRKGLTSCLPSGHVMCPFRTEECSFAAFLVSKQWFLVRAGQHAFSYSMETICWKERIDARLKTKKDKEDSKSCSSKSTGNYKKTKGKGKQVPLQLISFCFK